MSCCRICLKFSSNMTSLQSYWQNQTLQDLLEKLINQKPNEINSNICQSCTEKLIDSYNFKKQCLEAEEALLVQPSTSPKETLRHCSKCNLNFTSVKDYKNHSRNVHSKLRECPKCGNSVRSEALSKHLKSHQSKENLCSCCGKSFSLPENLLKHMRIHENEKKYKCPYCEESFVHWNSRKSHILAKHTHEKKFCCKICDLTFAQASNLTRHIRRHLGDLRHSCSECSKKFLTSTELKNHVVTHTKTKEIPCDYCGVLFATQKTKLVHEKTIHLKERNYVCPQPECLKRFTQSHVLKTHMKRHGLIPPVGTILSQKSGAFESTKL